MIGKAKSLMSNDNAREYNKTINYKQHHINQTLKNPKIKQQVLIHLIRLDLQKKT